MLRSAVYQKKIRSLDGVSYILLFFCHFSLGRVVVASPKIAVYTFPGPMRSYTVKETHIGSSQLLVRSFGTDTKKDRDPVTFI